jgi:hypothetical protein
MEIAVLSLGLDVRENLKDKEELGIRRTALLSLDLNRWHEDEGGEDGGRHSRWAQTPRHTRNQEEKTWQFSLLGNTRPNNGHRRYMKHTHTLCHLLTTFS